MPQTPRNEFRSWGWPTAHCMTIDRSATERSPPRNTQVRAARSDPRTRSCIGRMRRHPHRRTGPCSPGGISHWRRSSRGKGGIGAASESPERLAYHQVPRWLLSGWCRRSRRARRECFSEALATPADTSARARSARGKIALRVAGWRPTLVATECPWTDPCRTRRCRGGTCRQVTHVLVFFVIARDDGRFDLLTLRRGRLTRLAMNLARLAAHRERVREEAPFRGETLVRVAVVCDEVVRTPMRGRQLALGARIGRALDHRFVGRRFRLDARRSRRWRGVRPEVTDDGAVDRSLERARGEKRERKHCNEIGFHLQFLLGPGAWESPNGGIINDRETRCEAKRHTV